MQNCFANVSVQFVRCEVVAHLLAYISMHYANESSELTTCHAKTAC